MDIMSQIVPVGMDQGGANATVSSTATGDYVNMENYQFVTFLLTTGTITVGGKVGIRKSKTAAGSAETEITSAWVGNKFYSTATRSYSATSTGSSGKYIVVANSDDSKTLYATFDATLLSASYNFVGAYFVSSTWNGVITGTYLLHGPRYSPPGADPVV